MIPELLSPCRSLRAHAFALCLLLLAWPLRADELVPAGSAWRYRDNGSNQGTAWRAPSFNDSAWATGAAELGYGDGDETTTVSDGPDESRFITTYFRHAFAVADPSVYASLTLSTLRDDGAVVYLNGVEVWRSENMPGGSIGYQTRAEWALGTPEEATFYDANVSSSLLVAGQNVLAVEVHQADVTSSDVSFDLRLEGLTSFTVTRGPYLQLGTPTSVHVRWRTNAPTNSRVRHGTSAENLDVLADDTAATMEHEITLNGLTPATTYYYSIGSTSEVLAGDATYTFATAPSSSTGAPTRIWVLGDSGAANRDAEAVRDAYYGFAGSTRTNVWLMLGDNAYEGGSDAEYQAGLFDMYPTLLRQTVLWPTIGNHDTAQQTTVPPTLPYFAIFSLPTIAEAGGVASATETYYSFDYADIHFVCLDSMTSDRSPTGPMLTWLDDDLAANTRQWVIAYWHHPPYTKGSHDSDVEEELIEIRENALPILESHGVDLVLSGHSHAYERSYLIDGHYGVSSTFVGSMKKDGGSGNPAGTGPYGKPTAGAASHEGTVYAVAGSGSIAVGGPFHHPAMFVSMLDHGSMVLDVDGSRLDAKFLRKNGTIGDSFSIIKGPPAVPPDAPSGLQASAISTTAIDVGWTDNSTNEAHFSLERCTGAVAMCNATPTLFAEIAQPAANATSYSDSNLTPDTTYSYRLRAGNTNGNSAYTGTASAATQPCPFDVAPEAFSFPTSGGAEEVTISTMAGCAWQSSSPVAWITIDSGASGSGSGTTTFAVAANDGAGRDATLTIAGTSVTIEQAAMPPPSTPTGVSARGMSDTKIRITWTGVAGATGYEVFRASAGSPMAMIANVSTATHDDDTVSAGAAYRYSIRAINAAGASAQSIRDLAVAMTFSDDTLPAGTTVKAAHLAERRNAVNAVRALAGLSSFSFTNAAVPGTSVRAVHVTELRTALDQALAALGDATGGYSAAPSAMTTIKALHFREISNRVQ
jgi:hypothetical protein